MESNQPSNENNVKPDLSVGLRVLILTNIILLAGGAAWWASGYVKESAAKAKIEAAEQAANMEKLMKANPQPRETVAPFPGQTTYALDASSREKWIHFSFGKVNTVAMESIDSQSTEWDIAFRRAKILTNGGATGKNGQAEVAAFVEAKFDDIKTPPSTAYYKDLPTENISENMNPALDKWYEYNFLNHKLTPKKVIYVMKTATGDFVKFQIMDYYCGGAAGCYTIKYEFMGK